MSVVGCSNLFEEGFDVVICVSDSIKDLGHNLEPIEKAFADYVKVRFGFFANIYEYFNEVTQRFYYRSIQKLKSRWISWLLKPILATAW